MHSSYELFRWSSYHTIKLHDSIKLQMNSTYIHNVKNALIINNMMTQDFAFGFLVHLFSLFFKILNPAPKMESKSFFLLLRIEFVFASSLTTTTTTTTSR